LPASSIPRSATRSLPEPPGLKYATSASTCAGTPRLTRRSRTSGVSPISSMSESYTRTDNHLVAEALTGALERFRPVGTDPASITLPPPVAAARTPVVTGYGAPGPAAGRRGRVRLYGRMHKSRSLPSICHDRKSVVEG